MPVFFLLTFDLPEVGFTATDLQESHGILHARSQDAFAFERSAFRAQDTRSRRRGRAGSERNARRRATKRPDEARQVCNRNFSVRRLCPFAKRYIARRIVSPTAHQLGRRGQRALFTIRIFKRT